MTVTADSHGYLLLPADDYACGNYRMVWPGLALRSHGYNVYINRHRQQEEVPIAVHNRQINVSGNGGPWIVDSVTVPAHIDMVVLQRPNTRRLYETIVKIQEQGVKVAVDVDDALWLVPRDNPAWINYNQDVTHGPHWKWLVRCCQQADVVTVSTPAIAEKVGGIVVRNAVPAGFLELGRAAGSSVGRGDGGHVTTVGWAASLATHRQDPAVTKGRVAELVRRLREQGQDVLFLSVGGGPGELRAFGFDGLDDPAAAAVGEVPFQTWAYALSTLDVSLVPLVDSQFNRAKSWLKGIESAAVGAVPVMSPTPENLLLERLGAGVTASTPSQWERKIKRLLTDDAYRVEARESALSALKDLTIEATAWRWIDAWEDAWRGSVRPRDAKVVGG